MKKVIDPQITLMLNQILPCRTQLLKKASRDFSYGHCVPSSNNKIYLRLKMAKHEYLEMTWVHEWMHHYHHSFDKHYNYTPMRKAKAIHKPPISGCAHFNQMEEECEAFALLIVQKSKEYDLEDCKTKWWLYRMWLLFWDKYPALRNLLSKHTPPT